MFAIHGKFLIVLVNPFIIVGSNDKDIHYFTGYDIGSALIQNPALETL